MADVVLGVGEVGSTICDLLERRDFECVGIDADAARNRGHAGGAKPDFIHVCTPGDMEGFEDMVLEAIRTHSPEAVLIHSTVRPGTAASLQAQTDTPIVSAPARGVHSRFLNDMVRYTKFIACDMPLNSRTKAGIAKRFVKVQWMSSTKTAELAKILTDTTYYGWLINYAQITDMICRKEGVDYDEMWTFADEIHRYLGNRPKMCPGVIGGHCVIPNLELLDYSEIQSVRTVNDIFRRYKDALKAGE